MTIRSEAYRLLLRALAPAVLAVRDQKVFPRAPSGRPPSGSRKRAWFHAASAGELESLWTVIDCWARAGNEAVLTVFSASADRALERLRASLDSDQVVLAGRSPLEGEWYRALSSLAPDVFVTAKYEAWPELWMALRQLDVPLTIVGARARTSLRIARMACRWSGLGLPRMSLLTTSRDDEAALRELFPLALIETTGDPRWDRIAQRASAQSQENKRARQLMERFADLPRPWGVLGSAWPEDLDLFAESLEALKGTLWVVPHSIADGSVAEMTRILDRSSLSWVRTTDLGSTPRRPTEVPRVVVVDEMGFLLELYGSADWAYVGGGFGKGVHSTMEPAYFGLPVSCGPGGASKFPEIAELKTAGQLTVVSDAMELKEWLSSRAQAGRKAELGRARYGGTSTKVLERIVSQIVDMKPA